MAKLKPFEFSNPVFVEYIEEEPESEVSSNSPAPSPKPFVKKRSKSLSEADGDYQDLTKFNHMYQPLKKQHDLLARRELPATPSTPNSRNRNRRRSEPVVMLTNTSSSREFGCSGRDRFAGHPSALRPKSQYMEPIDSTKSFRKRINSPVEQSKTCADIDSRISVSVDELFTDKHNDPVPHYYILEPPADEKTSESQATSREENNGKETNRKRKLGIVSKHNDMCRLEISDTQNTKKAGNRHIDCSDKQQALESPYYHVLENSNPAPCSNQIVLFLVCCVLLFAVVTFVIMMLMLQGKIELSCSGCDPKGLAAASTPKVQRFISDEHISTLWKELNSTKVMFLEEKENSRRLAEQVINLTRILQQSYNLSQGPAGPPGSQGIQGVQGPHGPQGSKGEQGLQGPRGFNGSEGPRGVQGFQGFNGSRGLPGIQGPPGVNGSQGAPGPRGLRGVVVDFSGCSWKSKIGATGTGYADAIVPEPKGKRIMSVICSTDKLSRYTFQILHDSSSNTSYFKCKCKTTSPGQSTQCTAHYCECPLNT